MPTIQIKKLRDDAIIPKYQTDGAAGFDLHAIDKTNIPPRGWRMVYTGLAMAIPEGYEGQVRPRSGLAAKHGITIVNTPGTVDSDYRGEIMVNLYNNADSIFMIEAGDRIAQMVINQVPKVEIHEVKELSTTIRGEGGLGSTGIN